MMTPDKLKLMQAAYNTFKNVLETYQRMRVIHSVNLYYEGHKSTMHGSVTEGDAVSRVCRDALVEHWRCKLELELANLQTFGVDAISEMPEKES